MGKLLDAARGVEATPKRGALREAARASEVPDLNRAPSISTNAATNTLAGDAAKLAAATYDEVKAGGGTDEEASARASAVRQTATVLGDNADTARVRAALEAHMGTDTTEKVMRRAFGQSVREVDVAPKSQAEKWQAQRDQEVEFRNADELFGETAKNAAIRMARTVGTVGVLPLMDTLGVTPDALKAPEDKGLSRVLEGEKVPNVEASALKPWMEEAKDAAVNIKNGALSFGTVPLYDLLSGKDMPSPVSIVKGALADPDVQATEIAENVALGGAAPILREAGVLPKSAHNKGSVLVSLLAQSPLPDVAGEALRTIAPDEGQSVVEFWDHMRPRPEFDAALADLYERGDVAKADALTWEQLPEMAKGGEIDAARVRAAVERGDPAFAPLAGMLDTSDGYLAGQAAKLPLSALRRIQPEIVPDLTPGSHDMDRVRALRESAAEYRGDEQMGSMGRLMTGLLLTPVGKDADGSYIVAPSKFNELLRLANAAWSGVNAMDISPMEPVSALPRAALYAAEGIGVPGAATMRANIQKTSDAIPLSVVPPIPGAGGIPFLPTAASMDRAIRSGVWDDLLDSFGYATSERYQRRYAPESTWLSRTLTGIANDEAGTQLFADTLARLGEDPNSTIARTAGMADLAVNVALPAEEMALLPFVRSAAALNRARRGSNAALELGMDAKAARKVAFDSAMFGGDPRQAAANSFARAAMEGIENGTLDPAAIPVAAKNAVDDVLRAARMSEADIAAVWNSLADRRAQILTTASDVEKNGGPVTQALRASVPWMERRRELDTLVNAGNLTPQGRDLVTRFLEASAFRATREGSVGSPEEYFARHSWERGVEGEALPVDTLYQERAPKPPTLAQQIRDAQFVPTDDIVNILGAERPAYLDEVSKFILEQREKVRNGELAPRDVAKAYLITVASQNARSQAATGVERLLGHRLDDRFIVMDRGRRFVRPEEATAAWLAEPIGKQTLDALDRGEWFQEGWDDFMRVRDAFGSNGVRTHGLLDAAPEGQISLRNVGDAVAGINAAKGDPAKVMDVIGQMRGIGTGKAPFIGHMLGFGEMPTMDAREIAAWMTGKKVVPANAPNAQLAKTVAGGKAPVSRAFMQRMIDGFNRVRDQSGLGADLPPETFGAIMHHWLWDRIANEATTHEGVYHTMRYASESPGTVHGSIERAPIPRPDVNPQGFYSALRRAVEGLKGDKFSADQLRATLKNTPGVKADEIEWTGLDRFLAEHPKPTKGEVLDWLDENAVVVEEKVLGEDPARTRFNTANDAAVAEFRASGMRERDANEAVLDLVQGHRAATTDAQRAAVEAYRAMPSGVDSARPHYAAYQLPGGTNYREVLFYGPGTADVTKLEPLVEAGTATPSQAKRYNAAVTTPQYKAPHFGREGEDLLAHTRVSDRTGPNGEKILHVEEIQSDWHQAGREKGYRSPEIEQNVARLQTVSDDTRRALDKIDNELAEFSATHSPTETPPRELLTARREAHTAHTDAYMALNRARQEADAAVPTAPFAKNWHELVMKRILRMAAEGGYDGVSWTTGIQQVRRYEDATRAAVDEVRWTRPTQMGDAAERRFQAAVDAHQAADEEVGRLLDEGASEREVDTAIDARDAAEAEMEAARSEVHAAEVAARSYRGDPADVEVIGYKNGRETYRDTLPPEKLPDVLGKEIARKIVDSPDASGSLTGPDLTVGGEGMKGFYDRMLPQWLDKYAKKWGVRPTETRIATTGDRASLREMESVSEKLEAEGKSEAADYFDAIYNRVRKGEDFGPVSREVLASAPPDVRADVLGAAARFLPHGTPVHYLPIPDNMRASILTEGQPLFSRKGNTVRGAISPDARTVTVPNPDYAAWQAKEAALAAEVEALRTGSAAVPNPEWAAWDAERARLASAGGSPANEPVPDWVAEAWRQDRGIYALQKYAGIGYNRAATLKAEVEAGRMTWADAVNAARSEGPFATKGANPTLSAHMTKEPPRTVAGTPNPARAEWEAKGKATAAEVEELKRAGSKELADLQARRESLQKNPRPDDPDWEVEVEEVNDRIGEIVRTTSVNPDLAAKEAELAAMRANPPPRTLATAPDPALAAREADLAATRAAEPPREIAKPDDVSRWLIKLFRTGDVKTAFHEGTHLFDLMMGEGWTRKAAKALGFDDDYIDAAFREGLDDALASEEGGAVRGTIERAPKTETPEFKAWFGDSKVVDAEGKPLVVNHATTASFDMFDMSRSNGVAGAGAYFTDGPPMDNYGGVVMPVYLSVRNPIDLRGGDAVIFAKQREMIGTNMQEARSWPQMQRMSKDFRDALIRAGHDGVLMSGERPGETYYVAFRPEQIKSATANVGTYDPTNPSILRSGGQSPQDLMTEIREAIAEAGTAYLRGRMRPGSNVANVMEDLRDTVGDLWRRVRGQKRLTTPDFKRFMDETFAPDAAEMQIAAHLVDERTPGPMGRTVTVSGDIAERLRDETVRRSGQAAQAADVMRRGAEIRQALGIADNVDQIPVGDLLARAIAYTASTHAFRGWGWGELEGLTARTAIPAARAKRIERDLANYRKAAFGGKPPMKSALVDAVDGGKVEVMVLDRDQQRAMRGMLDDLQHEPISVDLPERLQDPNADLSQMSIDEWNNVVDRQLEVRAGAGAWRDRIAERASVSGAVRLGQIIMDTLRDPQARTSQAANDVRDAFILSHPADQYVNPAQREVLKATERELGQAGSNVVNRVVRAMREDGKGWREVFRTEAAAMPPEVVPVDALDTLAEVDTVPVAKDITEVAPRLPKVRELFARAPIADPVQMAQEATGVRVLEAVSARMTEDGMDFGAALSDAGVTANEAADAMAVVQEGVRRRAAAVDGLGTEILLTFAGSKDDAVLKGFAPGRLREAQRQAYANWYTGQWDKNLDQVRQFGQATAGPKLDQGVAALNVMVRLEARKILGSLARRLVDAGVTADPATLLREGIRMDRPYRLGAIADEVGTPLSVEQYRNDVIHYIEAQNGWKVTSEYRLPNGEGGEGFNEAAGMRGPSGMDNKAAYNDAMAIRQSWGFKTGKMDAWTSVDIPGGGRIVMPDTFREPIYEALESVAPTGGAFGGVERLGELIANTSKTTPLKFDAINAATTTLGTAWQYAFGMYKTGLTTGIGPLIRPGFFVGNAFGGALQLYQGVGAVDALRIMGRAAMPTAEGATVRRVLARMWDNGKGSMHPAEMGFFDAYGRWYSDQRIADGAARFGLNSSLVKAELSDTLVEDIRNAEPTLWNRLMESPKLKAAAGAVVGGALAGPGGAVVGSAAMASLSRNWQKFMREAATGIDNYYRVSAYIDALKRGIPETEAAELARRVAFDYNALTEFEKSKIRPIALFYAYQRNNQNLFWWTLLNEPNRVMTQLRMLRGLQRENLQNDADLFAPEWTEGRAAFNWRPALEQGNADHAMAGEVSLSPMLPVADAIGFWQSLLAAPTEFDPAAAGDLVTKLNPWIQSVFVAATGVDPYSRRSIEGFNTIPNFMMELDGNLTGGLVTRGVFGARNAQFRNPASEAYPGAPQWVVDPDSRAALTGWYAFRNLTTLGPSLDTITALQRADLGDSLLDHGPIEALIRTSRTYAESKGREPFTRVEDTQMNRPTRTEAEETASWLGIKGVDIPRTDQALDPLIRQREADLQSKAANLRKEGTRRYH